MTMDKSDLKSVSEEQTEIKVVKRPFDVAFLMLPDEKKQKPKLLKSYECYNNNQQESDEEIEVGTNQKYIPRQIFDDPNLIKAKHLNELRSSTSAEQKSAFTKVNLRISPNLSLSPDLNYQNSLSPSPPIVNRSNYPQTSTILSSFKNQQTYQSSFIPQENPFLLKTPDLIQPSFQKMRPMYRPDLPYNYQQFPNQEMLKITPEIRSPAAILTSLLPPSLAALSLPAQNVCAKCNISFRMTSDLVYHMRSHHKNDSVDMNRRRREEKLKCPVCSESFRERHHLTRHMTAHQDKDEEEEGKKCVPNAH